MGKLICVKCHTVIRQIKSKCDFASICMDCARLAEESLTDEQRLAMANVGLDALIDEATGYQKDRPQDDLRQQLRKYSTKRLSQKQQ